MHFRGPRKEVNRQRLVKMAGWEAVPLKTRNRSNLRSPWWITVSPNHYPERKLVSLQDNQASIPPKESKWKSETWSGRSEGKEKKTIGKGIKWIQVNEPTQAKILNSSSQLGDLSDNINNQQRFLPSYHHALNQLVPFVIRYFQPVSEKHQAIKGSIRIIFLS